MVPFRPKIKEEARDLTGVAVMHNKWTERSHTKPFVRETRAGEGERASEKTNQRATPSWHEARFAVFLAVFRYIFTRSVLNPSSRTVLCVFWCFLAAGKWQFGGGT